MACPFCGCEHFYIKDPEDEYETYEFDLKGNQVVFASGEDETQTPQVAEDTEAYCDNCAWHGKMNELRK
jgi:hypothetical protein